MSKQKPSPLPWVAAAVAVGTAACYQGPITRRYRLNTPKLARGSRLRLAVLSDLHGTHFGDRQQQLVRRVSRERPDAILLPGDIFDERYSNTAAIDLLRGLVPLAPVYYAPGNHEYRTRRMDRVVAVVRDCGATPLLDAWARLDTRAGPLIIAGCEDTERCRYHPGYDPFRSAREAFAGIPSDCFAVLLGHRPERVAEYRRLGLNLVVSGHAHGGQWRVPWLINGVFAPDQGVFPPYAGGLYHHGNMAHLVSRGLAVYPGLPRIWNPPEIAVVDVTGRG